MMIPIKITRRSQSERLVIAEALLSEIWDEFQNGEIEKDILQTAINCQIDINRIVFKLNEVKYGTDR